MQYIFKFLKFISVSGWILYLIKFIFEEFVECQLFYCIWIVFFTMTLYLISVIETWYSSK